jgi:radical SAM protein with 4Fe4S-binding SPASM domain
VALPVDAVVAVTYRCDSRCSMCNIWQLPPGEELAPAEYRALPHTLRDVNITGGEPFLRDDIVEIVRVVHERCGGPRIVISTNGFERRRIVHAAPALMKIGRSVGIAVSLDGIGEMHDEIRGVAGGFDRVVETLKQLRTMGYRNVRVAFTAQRANVEHLGAVYDLSRQFGYQFTASVAQNSEFYFSTDENQAVDPRALDEELRFVMRRELLSASPKRWLRAYFYAGVLRFNAARTRMLSCRAGGDSFFMDPAGIVYPCLTLNRAMGTVRERKFEEIWESAEAERARAAVRGCAAPCWMICTARTAMMRRPQEPARWILGSWLKLAAGKRLD